MTERVVPTYYLAEAAADIERFIAKLDNTYTECKCCGTRRYNNWPDHLAHDALSAAVLKIRRSEEQYSQA